MKVAFRQYYDSLRGRHWCGNQITLTLQDEEGLINRNLAMRWGQIGLTVKIGIVRLAFLKNVVDNMKNLRAKLVALTIVDEEGNRIFSQQDVNLLGKKSALALNRVFEVAQRLNGLKPEDVEELTKNSESDQSDDFISD